MANKVKERIEFHYLLAETWLCTLILLELKERYEDMKRYFVDIACLQKTKIKNGLNSEKITCFPTKEDRYGFRSIVNEKWKNNIHKQWKENVRICILQLNPPDIKEPKKYTNPIYKKIKLVKGLRMKLKIKK